MFNLNNHVALSAGIAVLLVATLNATTPVSITSTTINSSKVLTVFGSGFATGATPTFIFNGHTLKVKSFTNTSVAATLPSTTRQGSYQVIIRNSQGRSATVSTTYDVDPADVDPALVTNSTLAGKGTSASPLRIKVPLSLSSSSSGPPLTLNNSAFGTALDVSNGNVSIDQGTLSVFTSGGPGVSITTLESFDGLDAYATTAIYGLAANLPTPTLTAGVVGDCGGIPGCEAIVGMGDAQNFADAGDFSGDVNITGKLTKGGGSFRIDHPVDPANKYLSHSFVESPDMKNIYDGVVITDATGFARVTMPEYFEALNRDFRYQLTVIGQFAQAIIGSKIAGNEFTIRTDKPGVEVSWQVTGIRQDAWANAHRIPVEEEKPEKERDHYIHPELFNQPPEKSIEWAKHPEFQKKLAEHRAKMMSIAAQHNAQ